MKKEQAKITVLFCKVSVDKSTDSLSGVPLYLLSHFFLDMLFFFFLFDNFIIIYLIVDSFEYIFLGSIGLLETEVHQFSRSVVSDSL